MEEMILQFIATYGWKLALIACSGIFVLGILKFFNIFDKIEKSKRKYLYAGISAGISIIASGIYLAVVGAFEWSGFAVIAGAIYGINQALYALYENVGIRTLLRKLGNIFIKIVAKKQLDQAKSDIIDDTVVKENVENIKA
jgi:hypothetical protein